MPQLVSGSYLDDTGWFRKRGCHCEVCIGPVRPIDLDNPIYKVQFDACPKVLALPALMAKQQIRFTKKSAVAITSDVLRSHGVEVDTAQVPAAMDINTFVAVLVKVSNGIQARSVWPRYNRLLLYKQWVLAMIFLD